MVYCGKTECKFNVLSSVGNYCCDKEYLYLDSDGVCMDFEISNFIEIDGRAILCGVCGYEQCRCGD